MTEQIEHHPLSAQQRRIWDRFPTDGIPAAQLLLELDGDVSASALRAAVDRLVERHEILRTVYRRAPGMPMPIQAVLPAEDARPEWSAVNLRDVPAAQREAAMSGRPAHFDPTDGPVLRLALYRTAARRHLLRVCLPVLNADPVTLVNLAAELAGEYARRPAPDEALQNSQFAYWQEELSGEPEAPSATAFFRARTAGPVPLLPLEVPDGEGDPATASRVVPPPLLAAVRQFAERHGASVEAVFAAALRILLSRVGGVADPTLAVRFAGRRHPERAGGLGPYARWIDLDGGALSGAQPFASVVAGVDRDRAQVLCRDEFAGPGPEDPGHDAVGFELVEVPEPVHAGGVRFAIGQVEVPDRPARLRMSCTIWETGSHLALHHAGGRFPAGYAPELLDQYVTLVAAALDDPARPIAGIDLVQPSATPLPEAPGAPGAPDSADRRDLVELVEESARSRTDAVALISGSRTLTYGEVVARAGRLAAVLGAAGAGIEARVAICVEPGPEMVIALLGVLWSGAAYVPIDPSLPPARATQMCRRAGCCSIVLTSATSGLFGGSDTAQVLLDEPLPDLGVPARRVPGDAAAYILFTSGSTGVPKGVIISRSALTGYVRWAARAYLGGSGSGSATHSSIGFDFTVTSIFPPLIAGVPILVEPGWRDLTELVDALDGEPDLTLLKLTPSLLHVLNAEVSSSRLAGVAHTIVVGGEALTADAVAPWRIGAPETRIVNEYGPTEATVGCCTYEISARTPATGPVPIGRPVAGMTIHLLDDRLRPVPAGMAGEIHIGGPGLARGYLDDAAQTADRFIPDPFSAVAGGRMYRTGDLATRTPDGDLVYLGRRDEQIKIYGYRVEPAEIRAELLRLRGVRDAVVVLRTDPDHGDRLVAYLVAGAQGDARPDAAQIRRELAERLPGYLVPDRYVWLTEFPVTINGKLDRTALPAPPPLEVAPTPEQPGASR